MFELGIISDEVTGDFSAACELISSWGLKHVELRMLWGKNILQLSDAEVAEAVTILQQHGLNVTAISSPVFKSPLDGLPRVQEADFALAGSESLAAQLELLARACVLAEQFGTRLIRVFTFWREEWSDARLAEIVRQLGLAAEIARDHDVLLAIENEPVCMVGTGRELGLLGHALADSLPADLNRHLGLLWDPGNALAGGEAVPWPDGYAALRGLPLLHVHLKDMIINADGKPGFVPLGQGLVDYPGQLEALARDGYRGTLVLEPHYRPAGMREEDAALACVRAAEEMLDSVDHRVAREI
jgi:sugar phosphate isomerase/epimerase